MKSKCIDLIFTNKNYISKILVSQQSPFSLKSQILKIPPKIKTYRNYNTFDENTFNENLKSKLHSIEKLDYTLFEAFPSIS